jgi:hypothetical protein
MTQAQRGLRAFGIAILLSYFGIWSIKLDFLLFFKRPGTQITTYLVFWWAVLFVTMASGAVNLGLYQYQCVFGPVGDIMVK